MDFREVISTPYFIIFAALWEVLWKGLAMWKASKRGEKGWFVIILVFNTLGVLPVAYLLMDKYGFLDSDSNKPVSLEKSGKEKS
jgi:hypothetical protein